MNIANDNGASAADATDAMFALKVALGAVVANYFVGPVAVIVFCGGWLWGVRNLPEERERT